MKNTFRWIMVFANLLLVTSLAAVSETYYVAPGGAGGDFKSPAQAADNIQAALDVAEDGDTILVAEGTYLITEELLITNGVSLIGEAGPEATIVDAGYEPDGAVTSRCLRVSGGNPLIAGFTFCNGAVFDDDGGGIHMTGGTLSNCVVRNNLNYMSELATRYGGGIFAVGSRILNCQIVENQMEARLRAQSWSGGGGGVRITGASGLMSGCIISNNTLSGGYVSTMLGAGVRADSATLENCTISFNTNYNGWGGGMRIDGANIVGCQFVGNVGKVYGGGCFAQAGTFTNCLFAANFATANGGGLVGRYTAASRSVRVYDSQFIGNTNGAVYFFTNNDYRYDNSSYVVQGCFFEGNTGYGIYLPFGNDLVADTVVRDTVGTGIRFRNGTIRNSLIADNLNPGAEGAGIVVLQTDEGASISACTIAGNVNENSAGDGLLIQATTPELLNVSSTIIAGNGSDGQDDVYDAGGVSAGVLQYSCVGVNTGFSGPGLIEANPLFRNPAAGNYRLHYHSPCVNSGLNEVWMTDATDLDGNPRIQCNFVDMGAYETGPMPGTLLMIN